MPTGGKQFSLTDLESRLEEHPDVLEAGVVALAVEDCGRILKPYITLKPGARIEGQGVREWLKSTEISEFIVPQEVEVVTNMPIIDTGKLDKHIMRQWARDGVKRSTERDLIR